jgi:hypothetical protein
MNETREQEDGYCPMNDEFGYSTVLHRWIFKGRVLDTPEEAQKIYTQQRDKRVETIYTALRETFEQVRRPGRNGLVIHLQVYAKEILHVNGSILLHAIESFCQQERITARKVGSPSDLPESWEILFREPGAPEEA